MGREQRLIREGEVTALNETLMTARVSFKDRDNLTTAELPILGRGSSSVAADYWLPAVGDRAVCIFAPNDDQAGEGWILGTRFSKKAPPVKAGGRRLMFGSGTALEFEDGNMNLTVAGALNVKVNGAVSIEGGGTVYIKGAQIRLNE